MSATGVPAGAHTVHTVRAAPVGPVLPVVHTIRALPADKRDRAPGSITEVPDGEPGAARTRHVPRQLAGAPGAIRRTGRPHGADGDEGPTAPGPAGPGIAGPSAAGAR
ncbi:MULTISPECIES: hypothetical protein [Streptomyces]|uniref:hypothetical protein n=1 Tax=Streptomyces TaxID=1883 RepID=UPI00069B8C7E|nr:MULTISPECIES: hypothetical protein [Streptomyces]MYU56995.1 hypothetical protein [Streptomyces sp. SID7805]